MQISDYYIIASLIVGLGIGASLLWTYQWNRDRNPEILSRRQLEKHGLPLRDNRISTIFTHKTEERIRISKQILEELGKREESGKERIATAKKAMMKTQSKLKIEQERIREMETKGEVRLFKKLLATFMQEFRMEGERIGATLASQVDIGHQVLFLEQVEQGHERKKVFDILKGGPWGKIDPKMLVDDGLRKIMDALNLDDIDADETAELWLEIREDLKS